MQKSSLFPVSRSPSTSCRITDELGSRLKRPIHFDCKLNEPMHIGMRLLHPAATDHSVSISRQQVHRVFSFLFGGVFWFLGVACAGSQCPAPGASLPEVHKELTGRGRTLLLPETDLLTPPPSPPSVVQLGGIWGSPQWSGQLRCKCVLILSPPAGQTVPPLPGLYVLIWSHRRGLCGLWRCCLHLMQRRYCKFFRLKALRDMHGGVHDPEVLKELCTAPDIMPRATKVMALSLGCAMSTLVVQERRPLAVSD